MLELLAIASPLVGFITRVIPAVHFPGLRIEIGFSQYHSIRLLVFGPVEIGTYE